jgi:hypothetical protein
MRLLRYPIMCPFFAHFGSGALVLHFLQNETFQCCIRISAMYSMRRDGRALCMVERLPELGVQ